MTKYPISGWEKLAVTATLVEAIVVILSISLIKSQINLQTDQLKVQTEQMRQQTDLARAANIQALASVAIPMNLEEVRSSEVTRVAVEGNEPEVQWAEDEIKQQRYQTLLASWLIFYENIYYQNSQGLVDREMYAAWHKDLEIFIQSTGFEDAWKDMKDSYHESFRNHVDELLALSPSKRGESR